MILGGGPDSGFWRSGRRFRGSVQTHTTAAHGRDGLLADCLAVLKERVRGRPRGKVKARRESEGQGKKMQRLFCSPRHPSILGVKDARSRSRPVKVMRVSEGQGKKMQRLFCHRHPSILEVKDTRRRSRPVKAMRVSQGQGQKMQRPFCSHRHPSTLEVKDTRSRRRPGHLKEPVPGAPRSCRGNRCGTTHPTRPLPRSPTRPPAPPRVRWTPRVSHLRVCTSRLPKFKEPHCSPKRRTEVIDSV